MTKTEILKLENRLYEAMKNSDLKDLDTLLHEDLLFIAPGGKILTKEKDLETYRSGILKINRLDPEIKELQIMDDLAIVVLKVDLEGTYQAEPFESRYQYIRFWKRFPDGIKVVGGSGVQI